MWNCVYKLRVKIWKISVHIQRRRFPGCNQHHLSRSLGISLLTLQVGKIMEMDEEKKDSTPIQGKSLATRIDFWKNENYDQTWLTKHKTGLPNSVTISGNMPSEEAGSGWWIMSLYTGDLKYLQNVKRLGFDPVNDRRNWKIEKKLVCLEGCFLFS